MKKNNLKFKIIGIFGFFTVFALLVCSLAVGVRPDIRSTEFASAVNSVDDSSTYIQELVDDTQTLPAEYHLDDHVYIISENQSDPSPASLRESSLLCWVYSSMKVLETSIMVQREEYHNFSETAMAVLSYLKGHKTAINSMGEFIDFDTIARETGLVYESEFSNDYYADINAENVQNYSFVSDLASKDVMTDMRYIALSDDLIFSRLPKNQQQEVIKRYIKKYGGVFAGIGTGVITSQGNVYRADDNPSFNNPDNDRYLSIPHAVCLIGWDDNNGFIALNSWGRDKTDFNTFYIPYTEEFYGKLYGYICADSTEKISVTDAVSTRFSSEFLRSDKNLSNIFMHNEDISVTYKVNDETIDFDDIFVNIFAGQNNVTNKFDLNFNEQGKIKITSKSEVSDYGGTYLVKIYTSDGIIETKDFYVYTGADLSYVQFIQQIEATATTDSLQLKNTFASDNVTTTYYISNRNIGNGTYTLKLYLPEKSMLENSGKVTVSEFNKTTTSEGEVSRSVVRGINADVYVQSSLPYVARINLTNLTTGNEGSLIDFSVTLTSLTGARKTYYFNFFISSVTSTETQNAKPIVYRLDGGKNSENNITRFPDYSAEPKRESGEEVMTSFKLYNPTKDNATFVGWYLSPDADEDSRVEYISNRFANTLVLYAVWLDNETEYYDIDFKVDQIKGYDEADFKNFADGDTITYGDTLKLLLSYTLKADDLSAYNYYTRYHIKVSNFNDISGTISKEQQQEKTMLSIFEDLEFPKLTAGSYEAVLEITLVINRSSSISAKKPITFNVSAKSVTAEFENTTATYDNQNHEPTVKLTGVYENDEVVAILRNENEQNMPNAGTYNFIITELNNPNYTLTGKNSCEFTINPADFSLTWGSTTEFVYNGYSQNPRPESSSNDDIVVEYTYFTNDGELIAGGVCRNVGEYSVKAVLVSTNYTLISGESFRFKITPKNLKVTFNDISQRFTLAPKNRQPITWTVEGLAETDTADVLEITCQSEGLTALQSGTYAITGTCKSPNYTIEVVGGTYTILGEYYVFYTLPDGSVYTEVVPAGENPKGITKDIYKGPLFGKIHYSEPLVYNMENATDMYIKVTYTNYTWIVFVVIAVLVFVMIYVVASRKTRNRNR